MCHVAESIKVTIKTYLTGQSQKRGQFLRLQSESKYNMGPAQWLELGQLGEPTYTWVSASILNLSHPGTFPLALKVS